MPTPSLSVSIPQQVSLAASLMQRKLFYSKDVGDPSVVMTREEAESVKAALDTVLARLQQLEGEQKNDQGAALLPADPSARVSTEPLPNISCLASNLREVKRGLENGLFGPPVPLGHPDSQKWVNAAMHISTIDQAIAAAEYLDQIGSGTSSLSEASPPTAQER